MSATKTQEPKVRVVCPDYTSRPMTEASAERWIADVQKLGACRHEHRIEPAA